MIDVLVPVLGRPQNAQPLYDSWDTHSPDTATLTFIVSPDDQEQIEACLDTGADVLEMDFSSRSGDYAAKINEGFGATSLPWVLNASDDITFTEGWWQEAFRYVTDDISVVATNDRANSHVKRGRFGTHCLIRRSYIDQYGGTFDNQPGVVLYEGYDHNYVDRELCEVAKSRGVYAWARESVIRHRHPLFRTAEWDDTYRKGHARIREDHALFEERLRSFNRHTAVI